MNTFWILMMLSSISVLIIINPSIILNEMIGAASGALTLSIELCAIYAVWLGIIELIDASGLSNILARILRPIIRRVFKVEDEGLQKLIALNISANMLGIGNASTPLGIKAIKAMDNESGVATFPMIMLVVINATSIQLLPTTIIGLRTTAGSSNASDIILPTLLVTIITTFLGIALVHLLNYIKNRKKVTKINE